MADGSWGYSAASGLGWLESEGSGRPARQGEWDGALRPTAIRPVPTPTSLSSPPPFGTIARANQQV
jgi:hypothetical protein